MDSNQLNQQLGQSLQGITPTLAPATGVYQKGAYTIQGYASMLKTWYSNYNSYIKNPQTKQVKLSDGQDVSLSDFGFANASGSGSIISAPFISFGASFDSSQSREKMDVENQNYGIDIVLTYGDMQAFTIDPGNWYVHVNLF